MPFRRAGGRTCRDHRLGRAFVERLETRRLLAEFGPLSFPDGRRYFSHFISTDEQRNFYDFADGTLPATVQVQVSRIGPTSDLSLRVRDQSSGTELASSDRAGNRDEFATASILDGGAFEVIVGNNENSLLNETYRLAVAADTAPGEFISTSQGFRANVGRNLGTLSIARNIAFFEFVGYLDTSAREGRDLVDTYFFDVPRAGEVSIDITDMSEDPAGGAVSADVTLYRDVDGDNRLETNEIISQQRYDPDNLRDPMVNTLNAGRFALVVSRLQPAVGGNLGGANYRLFMDYTTRDDAGNRFATARNIGALGDNTRSFADYLSPQPRPEDGDNTDIYRFTTVGDGPFVFDARLSGVPAGADFDIDLVRDLNNNGRLDSGEVVASGGQGPNVVERVTTTLVAPGTYFVRVLHAEGEGPYTLQLSNRNQDLAGSTLATALNIGNLFGRREFTDFLTATDTADIIRFRLADRGTISARLTSSGSGGADANLQLIQDLDGDGEIDADEVLAVSANGAGQLDSVSRDSGLGTYFLRVFRGAGTPAYTLDFDLDTAGETFDEARTVRFGGRNPDTDAIDFVGPTDASDAYQLTVTRATQLTVFFSLLDERVVVTVGRDTNSNDVFDAGEGLLKFTSQFGSDRRSVDLPTLGTYFIEVRPTGPAGTNYGIVFATARIDRAGNTLSRARDVGILSPTVRMFTDFVGDASIDEVDDDRDFYRFALGDNGPFVFTAQLINLTGDASLQLIRDADEDNVVDPGDVLVTRNNPGTASEQINLVLTTPGRYFVRVLRVSGQVGYALLLNAPSIDGGGNSLAAARDLGALTGTRAQGDFVGAIDAQDFFRFSVDSPGDLYAWAVPAAGDIGLQIIRDANDNDTIDAGEILASGETPGTTPELLNNIPLPAAGEYFARVTRALGDSSYNLTLRFVSVNTPQTPFNGEPFQIRPDAERRIEAEFFDNGGEFISFHDSDGVNDGGQLRTDVGVDIFTTGVPAPGGTLVVSNTRAGEFLEYSVNVTEAGAYDFDFRVASPEPGASFHLEVDNINVTGAVGVPDTDSFDVFRTVTKRVNLTAGPHVLKLAIDAEAPVNSRGGAFNFIHVRPGPAPAVVGPAADAFVQDGSSVNTNFGANPELRLKKNAPGFNREIYLKFDLSSVATITNAQLRLFGRLENNDIADVPVSVFSAADTTWQENTITFTNRPPTAATPIATTTVIDATPRAYVWDLTAFLQAEKTAGRNVVTLVLKADFNIPRFVTFDAREAAGENGPALVIAS